MTSVEKRRSGRKSGGHRKHSDGGFSDTSSCGSFLDETDREVSNLTDRAFRSLCIGDDAVYNDSDLCSSSPCTLRDRQLAFSQSGQDGDGEDREREELKRAAHESFSLRVQQYGQDWIHEGMYGAEIHRDPQWEVYGERTQGRVSATFQHSFVETSQQEESLREGQLSFLSNGATELSSQQRRSRSRVSSLIRAFNSEGHRDGAVMDGEWNDEQSWDKSALMSIQRELSEFSTYQQSYNSGHFPSAGPFSSRETNFYSSEVAAVAHMNSASSFMRSSHSKHSMSAQGNCNSNFFIHSEFSPFKVWGDHNRFPFQQGEVSGFMHSSEFPKWYETQMYKELSLGAQPHGPSRFDERGIRHPRNNLAPVVPPTPSRSTSTSTMLQKALAVEKRCESELAGHYPHRKRTQSLGSNRLPSQRPSTASPTIEMSRRVQDTISSVKALQQKLKMMTEQNITTQMTNQQGVLYNNNNLIPFGNDAQTVAPNVVSSNTSTTPFNISQLLTPLVHAHQHAETSEVRQCVVSPQPVEHAPVRAESRGGTPDVRMSSYKSRATSLLFNLKDNRKRVKSTYSPPKFKGLETLEKNKQLSTVEPRDTVIDIPDFPDSDTQFPQIEEPSRTNAASYPYVNQYYNPGMSLTTLNSQPATAHTGQYSEYTSNDYQPAQMQGEIVDHPGFMPENYITNQLAIGQNLHEGLSSFTPYTHGMADNAEILGGDVHRLKTLHTATAMPTQNAYNNQTREYVINKANTEQYFNETVGRGFTQVDRYQQLKDTKHEHSHVSSQDRWRQTYSQDTENPSLKTAPLISPWKQEVNTLMENNQHAQASQRAVAIKEELNLPRDKYRGENQQSITKDELRESFDVGSSSHNKAGFVNPNISNQLPQNAPFSKDTAENPAYYGQQQLGAFTDKSVLQNYHGHNNEYEMTDNYLPRNSDRHAEHRNQHMLYSKKDKAMLTQETGQKEPSPKGHEMQSPHSTEAKPNFEHNVSKNVFSTPDDASAPTMANRLEQRQFVKAKTEQAMADHVRAQHAQAELAKAQNWAEAEQPKEESARLILAAQTGSEKVKAELTEQERVKHSKVKHIEEGKREEEQAEQIKEKRSEQAKDEQTKAEQTRLQKVTEEAKNITEEAEAEPMKEAHGEQVKAEHAEAERLKRELIKTDLTKTEQAGQTRVTQAKTEQARTERIKTEQLKEERVRAEQAKREEMKAEQIRTEKVRVEHRKAEQVKQEQIKEQKTTPEAEKNKIVEHDSEQAGQVESEQYAKQTSQARKENAECKMAEQTKFEQTKERLVKADLAKTENMQDGAAKPGAKLTVKQQAKSERDKVEQVKTELAKAKAELAKIKEKMKGEQKDKVRNTILTKEDGVKKDVPLKVNINKNEEHKDQDQAAQMHQDRKDSVLVSRQSTDQVNRVVTEYERLREKYGFTDTTTTTTTTTNRNKLLAGGNVSSNDANDTSALSFDKVEITNNEKAKDKHNPASRFATDNTEKEEEEGSFKPNDVTDSHYVYSESSKEFKLSNQDYLLTTVDRAKSDTAADKVNNDSVEKVEKCDPLKHTEVSQQRDSDLVKPLALERKPKSTESSVGPGKDPYFIPPRALHHKERAQTKQEILTSKIKAHAEKEISAIKEKGFAIRDGFISKTSTKQLTGSQTVNIRQRPSSQEVLKKPESTISSNATPKHQMELSGIQMETIKSSSPPTSAAIPVKSAATTSQSVDHSQVANKESMKTKDNVLKPPTEAKKTGSYTTSKADQAPKNKQEKQEENSEGVFEKQKERLKVSPAVNTDHLNNKKEDPLQATNLDEAKNSKPMTAKKAESKHEAVNEDSAPSLSLSCGENETPVADDSLQIMGIMVSIRERNPSVDNGQRNKSTQEQINAKEKELSNSELDKSYPSSGLEVSKGSKSSKEVSNVKERQKAVQSTNATMKEDETKVDTNNHYKNVQDSVTQETRQNNVFEDVSVEMTDIQQTGSSTNARTQTQTQPQEPLTENCVPPTVTVLAPAKNKVLAETQPLQDNIPRVSEEYTKKMPKEHLAKNIGKDEEKSNAEEKNPKRRQTTHPKENIMDKMVSTGINNTNDLNRVHDGTVIKHDTHPSMKEDMTAVINPFKSRSIDGNKAPLLEEKRTDSTPPQPFNKTSPSNQLTENENTGITPKDQYKETYVEENNQVEDNVHIGSIAIRVVPAVTEDNLKMVEKHRVTSVPCDVAAANEHKQVASPSQEEKLNTLSNEDNTKNITPASTEKQIKLSLEDKLRVQHVLSSVRKISDSLKISNHQNSINTTSEENKGQPEKVDQSGGSVDESKVQPMEEDYFQVRGGVETINEQHSSANVGNTPDAVSKENEPPGLQPNKAAVSNETQNEGKNKVVAVDQSKINTSDSRSVSIQESKQNDSPKERQSNKNEKTEASQTIDTMKWHTDNQSSLSKRERQSSRNLHPTRENTPKETPEFKPKPKERVSTIPEISAIADYARLKVIVSEEQENTIQEFPPNKKEGFFPLIQSRHSRRPVFTTDPQHLSVKEKSLPNKTEVSSKVNKEPKPLVFPITEKEHRRTGMFKLGDKERQDKMLSDTKSNGDVLEIGAKHAQHLKERNKALTTHLNHRGSEELVAGPDIQRVCQADLGIHESNNPPLQEPTSKNLSQHLKKTDNSNLEKHEEYSSKAEKMPYLDKNSHLQPILGQVNNMKESVQQQTALRKNEKMETELTKFGQERQEKLGKQRLASCHEETTAKRSGAKHLKEEQAEDTEADMKIKHMLEERKASLAEEERRIAQREEERRAREREAIAKKIKERREKQREAERKAEEERRAKQTEQERASHKEEEMRAKQREEERRMKDTEVKRRIKIEQEERAKLREEEKQVKEDEERRRRQRAAQEEQQKRAVQVELQRRAVQEEEKRRAALEEQQRRAAQEVKEQRRAALEEQQRRAAQEEEQQRRAAQEEEQQRRAAQEEEQQRRAAQEEEQRRRAAQEEEQRRRAAQEEEEQRRAALEEQQRRAAQEEHQRRAAQEEEQRRRAAQEEEQRRRAAQEEEQRRRAAQEEEEQRRAALEEQQRRAAQEEQQRRVALEEQQSKAAQEEQQRRAAQEEQQRRAAQVEEQRRRAAQEEQQRRAIQEEEQRRRAAQEEEQRRRAAQEEEEQRKAAQEEQQRRDALEEQQRRVALEEQQRKAAQEEEQQRKAARKEKQRRDAQEEQQKREAQVTEQRRAVQEEEQKRAVLIEEQQRKTVLTEEQRLANQTEKILTDIEQEKRRKQKEERTKLLKESQTALTDEEKRVIREQRLAQRDDEIRAKKKEEQTLAACTEKVRDDHLFKEQKKTVERLDALQYYAITSEEPEIKPRERHLCSPLPSQQRSNPSGLDSTEDSHARPNRPHAPASPAPSLSRSNTSSPALGVKPSMFRVKDNTIRGSSFTKSVKPCFHKNFGEDFRVGSPIGSDRGEEEQYTQRRSAVTPLPPDTGSNRLAVIKESSTFQSASSLQDYSAPLSHYRPYSRRSIAIDEDDSRSIISNMSEDVESFATSAADLADVRGLYDYERPESACSFSSDVSRSLGKPPAVPPKSEKALRRAKRLTSRRIKKEMSKTVADSPAGDERPHQEVPSIPSSSSSTEVRSSNHHVVAYPHFSPPVSLAHAPAMGSGFPSSHTEHQSSHSSFNSSPHATGPISLPAASPHVTGPISLPAASPHATGPISLPAASPHVTAPVSLPVASSHATGPASHPAAPKTVTDIPSSPTLHHVNHPAPVTQYQVESNYPQSYPLTQRKVLQDLGSGQYFVVDVPVEVKKKTFFDPETGKYVQLNVRESAKSTSLPQPQQTYLQPQLQPQIHVKPQQSLSQNSPAGKPLVLYQGYHGYPQGYQPASINSVPHNKSSAAVTPHQDQQPVRESHSYGHPGPEMRQNSEGHCYSPEKTPYMDTVNDTDKTHGTVYNTQGLYESLPECDTNSQLAGSSVCENDNSAHPRYHQPRNIITMSELEDFMELSDW